MSKPNKSLEAQRGDDKIIYHEGNLPTPENVERYEAVLPGTMERLLSIAEKEQQHRHETEKLIILNESKLQTRAQLIALFVCIASFGMGAILILKGQSIEGLTALLVTLASFIGPYIYTQSKKNN